MLKNKLRQGLGKESWGRRLDRNTPDSDLMVAENNGVKGHFLYLIKQEVRTML